MLDVERLNNKLNNGEIEYILCASIWFNDNKDYIFKPYNIDKGFVISGWRHPQIFECVNQKKLPHVQGFLTNKNRFLDRKEALT